MNKIIIFSGVDKTGKDTLIRKVHELTNYKYPIINRFTESTYAYGKFRKRKLNYDKIFEVEDAIYENFDVYLIYLYASKENLKRRIINTHEKDITISDVEKLERYYDEYLRKTPFKYIKINTDKTIEENAREIVDFIENDNDTILEKIKKLVANVKNRGSEVLNTLEKHNVRITFDYKKEDLYGIINELYNYYLENTGRDADTIVQYENYYYNRIKHSLLHNVKKILLEQKQSLHNRQMIYTSNECISCIHLLKRSDKLLVNVYIRSSNVTEVLPLDLISLISIIDDVINEFNIDVKIIEFDIFIGSAHVYLR